MVPVHFPSQLPWNKAHNFLKHHDYLKGFHKYSLLTISKKIPPNYSNHRKPPGAFLFLVPPSPVLACRGCAQFETFNSTLFFHLQQLLLYLQCLLTTTWCLNL